MYASLAGDNDRMPSPISSVNDLYADPLSASACAMAQLLPKKVACLLLQIRHLMILWASLLCFRMSLNLLSVEFDYRDEFLK